MEITNFISLHLEQQAHMIAVWAFYAAVSSALLGFLFNSKKESRDAVQIIFLFIMYILVSATVYFLTIQHQIRLTSLSEVIMSTVGEMGNAKMYNLADKFKAFPVYTVVIIHIPIDLLVFASFYIVYRRSLNSEARYERKEDGNGND